MSQPIKGANGPYGSHNVRTYARALLWVATTPAVRRLVVEHTHASGVGQRGQNPRDEGKAKGSDALLDAGHAVCAADVVLGACADRVVALAQAIQYLEEMVCSDPSDPELCLLKARVYLVRTPRAH